MNALKSPSLAIDAVAVGKRYALFDQPSERLTALLMGRGRGSRHGREFWALQDVSFTVAPGEVVGLIGRNGAGKSTLLQMVCGTLTPTTGHIAVHGRVAALLELGAGFSPDFSGLENVYMNAAILGLKRHEVDAKLPSILAFADIGKFIHQPVKTYSSGMFMRLAFAVATSVEPDILVIDEALSVGDGAFARKSFDRIMALKDKGATILLCSHSMMQVQTLCSRVIWMEGGRIKMVGEAARVTSQYELSLAMSAASVGEAARVVPMNTSTEVSAACSLGGNTTENIALGAGSIGSAADLPSENTVEGGVQSMALLARTAPPGAAVFTHIRASVNGISGRDLVVQSCISTLELELGFASDPVLPIPSFVVVISHRNGAVVASCGNANDGVAVRRDAAGVGQARLVFPQLPLLQGDYTVNVLLGCERAIHLYEAAERVITLRVLQTGTEPGVVHIPRRWLAQDAHDTQDVRNSHDAYDVPDAHDAHRIAAFYAHCRDYWLALGRDATGNSTGMLNFGDWGGGQRNLFEAQRHLAKRVRALLGPIADGAQALEIGCGIGGVGIDLLCHVPQLHLTGVDISPDQLAVAQRHALAQGVASRLTLQCADAMALPFSDATFDAALCIESSFHYADKAAFFAESFRVLKPGAVAVVADITCADASQVKLRRGNHFAATQDYIALARDAGFEVLAMTDIGADVYAPLLAAVQQFNRTHRLSSGKYWSVVLRNYADLAQRGLMGYVMFQLRKPL